MSAVGTAIRAFRRPTRVDTGRTANWERTAGFRLARDLVARFQSMLRSKSSAGLDPWLSDAVGSLLGAFANGIAADRQAVETAITEPWNNGQTESQITKLKLFKQQMLGCAKLDLLHARLCAA